METVLPKALKYESPLSLINCTKTEKAFTPSNGTVFTPAGNNVMRISIPAAQFFLNTSQSYLKYSLINQTVDAQAQPAAVFATGFCPFSAIRVYCGSVLLEEINSYNLLANRLVQLQSHSYSSTRMTIMAGMPDQDDLAEPQEIDAGATRTYTIPLISAVFGVNKFIPLPLMANGLDLEFVLAPAVECLQQAAAGGANNYTINNARLMCEAVTFSPEIVGMLKSALQEAGSLSIPMQSFLTRESSITAGADDLSIPIQVSARSVRGFLHAMRLQAQRILTDGGYAWASTGEPLAEYSYMIDGTVTPSQPIVGLEDTFNNTLQVVDKITNYQGGSALLADVYNETCHVFGYNTEVVSCDSGVRSGVDLSRSLNPVVRLRCANQAGFVASYLTTYVLCDSELVISADGGVFTRY